MTTYVNELPSTREWLAAKLHSSLTKRRATKQGNGAIRINAVLSGIMRVVLHLAGFGLLTMAGFQFNIIAGLTVAAVSCFALSALMTGGTTDGGRVPQAPDLRTGR